MICTETQEETNDSTIKIVTLHASQITIEQLDDLVRNEKYPSRSEAIRVAIKDLLKEEHPNYIKVKPLRKKVWRVREVN